MPRPIDAATLAALTADSGYGLALAAALDFSGGWVRANTSPIPLTIGGETYAGVGPLGRIAAIEESIENQCFTATLELSGVDPSLGAVATGQQCQGRSGTISLVVFDNTWSVVGSPVPIFGGRMDMMVVELGSTATIQLTIADRRADWERPRLRRYTDADQQFFWPDDLFCAAVAGLQQKSVRWGTFG